MTVFKKGFTLIEILIVIAIIGILATVLLVPFSEFRSKQILDGQTRLVENLIQESRSKTLASQDDNQFGLYFESGQVTTFTGNDYAPGQAGNAVYTLSDAVRLTPVGFTDNELYFDKINGKASDVGSIDVYLVSDPTVKKTILVNGSGIISVN